MEKSIFGNYMQSIPPLEKPAVWRRFLCANQHFRTLGSVIGQGEIVLAILQKDSSLTPIKVAESLLQMSLFFLPGVPVSTAQFFDPVTTSIHLFFPDRAKGLPGHPPIGRLPSEST